MGVRRWAILLAFPLYVAALALISFLLLAAVADGSDGFVRAVEALGEPSDWLLDSEWWLLIGAPVVVLAASQAAFLVPIVARRPAAAGRSKSLVLTMIALAMAAAFTTAGFVYAIVDAGLLSADPWLERLPAEFNEGPMHLPWWRALQVARYPWVLVPVCWLFWSIVLIVFARRRPVHRLWGRLLGALFAGTVIELLVVLPVSTMVRRRTDCFCATGSFFGLYFSVMGLLWLTGPGVLIALTSRRRRLWWQMHCMQCGYPRGPSPGPRCPECGAEWEAAGEGKGD